MRTCSTPPMAHRPQAPPYRVFEITPRFVFAFGTSDNLGVQSTRFRLPPD